MKKIDIKTKNLHLRIFKTEDITPEYVKSLNKKEIIGLTESRYRKWDMQNVKQYVKEKANKVNDSLIIGIFLEDSGKHIGNIRLHSFSTYNKRVEVGAMIWDKNQWGKGYGSEALEAIYYFIFNSMKLHKIVAEYYSINKAPAKIAKKLGFKIEGILKDQFLVDGKYIDAIRIAKINPND